MEYFIISKHVDATWSQEWNALSENNAEDRLQVKRFQFFKKRPEHAEPQCIVPICRNPICWFQGFKINLDWLANDNTPDHSKNVLHVSLEKYLLLWSKEITEIVIQQGKDTVQDCFKSLKILKYWKRIIFGGRWRKSSTIPYNASKGWTLWTTFMIRKKQIITSGKGRRPLFFSVF